MLKRHNGVGLAGHERVRLNEQESFSSISASRSEELRCSTVGLEMDRLGVLKIHRQSIASSEE